VARWSVEYLGGSQITQLPRPEVRKHVLELTNSARRPTGPPSKAMTAQQADDVITKTAAVWRALLSRPLSSINSLSKSPSPPLTRDLAVPMSNRPAGPAYSPGDRAVASRTVAT
jgi:hypothetical protein